MNIRVIGHLHFAVESRSRKGVEYLCDLSPQGEHPYYCSCPAFTMHPLHHGKPCVHLRAVVEMIQRKFGIGCAAKRWGATCTLPSGHEGKHSFPKQEKPPKASGA